MTSPARSPLDPDGFSPWDLPSLDATQLNQLPSEPGIYLAYRHRRVLYIGAATGSMRNSWFRQNAGSVFQQLDAGRVAYKVLPAMSAAALEALRKQLIQMYDPLHNGYSSRQLQDCRAALRKLTHENKALKALLEKERALHQLALCQTQVHLFSRLIADLEADLGQAPSLEDWSNQAATRRSLAAATALLDELGAALQQLQP